MTDERRNYGPLLQACMAEHANGRDYDDLSEAAQEAMSAVAEDFAAHVAREVWRKALAEVREEWCRYATTTEQETAARNAVRAIVAAAKADGVDLSGEVSNKGPKTTRA